MAYFAALDTSPAATCIEMVAQSNVYVGIIGLRYGSAVRDRPDVSYAEMGFEAADERGQPRLTFLIHEDSVHLPPLAEPPEAGPAGRVPPPTADLWTDAVRVGSPAELELAVYQVCSSSWPRRRTPRPPLMPPGNPEFGVPVDVLSAAVARKAGGARGSPTGT